MDQTISPSGDCSYVVVTHNTRDPILPAKWFAELDADGYEVRKVSVLTNGEIYFADESSSDNFFYGLAEHPYPSTGSGELGSEFEEASISKDRFEKVWAEAQTNGKTLRDDTTSQ